jgi:hypothetical protein
MADILILWRLKDELDATGPNAHRRGDVVTVTKATHKLSSHELTILGAGKITGIPDALLQTVQEAFLSNVYRAKILKVETDTHVLISSHERVVARPRRFRLSEALTKVRYASTLKESAVDTAWDAKKEATTVPEFPWSEFRDLFFDCIEQKTAPYTDLEGTAAIAPKVVK